jgi:hypothetical protein
MKRLHWITGAALLGALLASSRPARAEIAIAGDVDVGLPVGQTMAQSYLSTGASFDLRLGYRFRIPYQPLYITPEIAAGYADLSAHIIRVRPGVRVSFGRFVIPYAFVHLGYGWASFDPLGTADVRGMTPFVSSNGLEFDTGAGVDFAVLRRLHVGAHLGYNILDVGAVGSLTLPYKAKWLNVGLNATLLL